MVRLTGDVFVKKEDVSAIEAYIYDSSPTHSGGAVWVKDGTIVTLTHGRKIYIRDLKPEQVYEKIFGSDAVTDEN